VSNRFLAGVDIGGTKTAVVLSIEPPHTMARLAFATSPEKGPAFTIKRIVASLNEILSSQGFTPADLAGIGVSCGGPLDPVRGVIQSPPNLPTWKDIPICRILEAEFQTPCYLENDANAGALAEEFQTPAEYIVDSAHEGQEPWERSFLEIQPSSVWILAAKRSEGGSDDTIIRLQERSGASTNASLKSSILGLDHSIPLKPWELKTVLIRKAGDGKAELREVSLLEI
jgi:hypothetical protein